MLYIYVYIYILAYADHPSTQLTAAMFCRMVMLSSELWKEVNSKYNCIVLFVNEFLVTSFYSARDRDTMRFSPEPLDIADTTLDLPFCDISSADFRDLFYIEEMGLF